MLSSIYGIFIIEIKLIYVPTSEIIIYTSEINLLHKIKFSFVKKK